MRNGEGSGEKLSSEFASPLCIYDPVDHHDEMDGGDDDDDDDVCCSSQYSSCGESDFDKYCSANSAMGTPSVCGSVGTVFHDFNSDSDFGSLKSFKLGGGNSSLRPFRVDRKLSNYRGSEVCDGVMRNSIGLAEGLGVMRNVEGSLRNEVGDVENLHELGMGRKFCGNEFNEDNTVNVGRTEQRVENLGADGGFSVEIGSGEGDEFHRGIEQVSGGGLEGLEVLSDLEYDGGEVERCSNEGETSLRDEHSEGEDSMFGYGTDDDRRVNVYHRTTIRHFKEGCHDNENKLVMTSAAAFGSDDWDDFMLETGGNPLGLLVQDKLQDVMNSTSSATVAGLAADNTLNLMGQDEVHDKKHPTVQNEVRTTNPAYSTPIAFPSMALAEEQEHLIDTSAAMNQVPCAGGLAGYSGHHSMDRIDKFDEAKQREDAEGIPFRSDNDVGINDQSDDNIQTSSRSHLSKLDQDPLIEKAFLKEDIRGGECEKKQQYMRSEEATGILNDVVVKSIESKEKTILLVDPLSDTAFHRLHLVSSEVTEDSKAEFFKEHDSYASSSLTENNMDRKMQTSPILYNRFEDHFTPDKTDTYERNEFFDEFVHDMEEILLDSSESRGSRFSQKSRLYHPQEPVPLRDGGSTASTSGAIDAYPGIQHLRIDGIEVVGAKQKEGDVSLGERLVGVKKYTVYVIRVWSGGEYWEVEQRYRDFCALYRHLKKVLADQGGILPSPWSSVEQESRKIFGSSSPDVIAERSVLIQECLRSVLHSRYFSSSLNALISFLSPSKADPVSTASDMHIQQTSITKSTGAENSSSLGKTISLVVNIQPHKSMKQLLDAQHYTCAGCHRNFNDSKTRMQDLVQALGWGKPRVCEYSGQLFCSSCHINDAAVLPARVLHYWDFTKYPVSQLAKSYLDSIYDQPMLCVSAVNPHLFLKVPTLQQVTNIRRKISSMLPYVRCPFRGSIYKGVGSRRYLLESNDFFALRDLVDLSKGMFAALPVMIETASNKILEHITEQCLVCCDAGIPCNARQVCDDPSSLIFPFQEAEVEKCKSCSSAFHKHCFRKIATCPCGARFKPEEAKDNLGGGTLSTSTSGLLSMERSLSTGLFSGLLSKVRPQVTRILGEQVPTGNNNVILMGSLPNTSL